MPVDNPENKLSKNTSLKVGGVRCIDFLITKETETAPAYIIFAKASQGSSNTVCQQVQNSPSLDPYFKSRVPGVNANGNNANKGYVAIGSNIKLER